MDRLESMTVLAAVVDAGSFSGAGRVLRMPVATVSRKVAELEAHLKVRLLRRSTRRLALTDTGRAYVASCRTILEQISAAERAAAGEFQTPRGELSMTAPLVLGRLHVLPVVCGFLTQYPEVNIRLVLDDLNLSADKPLDLAVRVGVLPDSRMVAVKIGEVRQVICASPEYLRRHGTPRTPEDLMAHRSVEFGLMSGSEWAFKTARGTRTVSLRPRLRVNTAEAALDAAIEGVGLTRVLSYQLAPHEASRRLVRLLREAEPAALPVHLLHAGPAPLPLKLRAFLDFATPRLRQRLTPRRSAPRAA